MLTPEDAYLIFKKEFPDTSAETVFDYGMFYVIDNCMPGDMVDDAYKIDKKTGEIAEFDFLEYTKYMQKLDDDEEIPEFHVAN